MGMRKYKSAKRGDNARDGMMSREAGSTSSPLKTLRHMNTMIQKEPKLQCELLTSSTQSTVSSVGMKQGTFAQ
jgi:hypothetical protein